MPTRKASPWLTAVLPLALLTGCGDDNTAYDDSIGGAVESNGTASKEPATPDSVRVANEILRCIRDGDAEGLRPHLSTNNANMSDQRLGQALKEWGDRLSDVTEVTEMRWDTTAAVDSQWAKLKEVDGEVFCILLYEQDDTLRLEDIISPSTAFYSRTARLWPE